MDINAEVNRLQGELVKLYRNNMPGTRPSGMPKRVLKPETVEEKAAEIKAQLRALQEHTEARQPTGSPLDPELAQVAASGATAAEVIGRINAERNELMKRFRRLRPENRGEVQQKMRELEALERRIYAEVNNGRWR